MSDDTYAAVDRGLSEDPDQEPGEQEATRQETADVEQWWKRWKAAREHDKEARKQYAIDRRYARGDTGFEVDVPLIPTFIDILLAFLYARDPDLDIGAARSVVPPTAEALLDAAQINADEDPEVQAMIQERAEEIALEMAEMAMVQSTQMTAETGQVVPQPGPEQVMPAAIEQARKEIISEQAQAMRRAWMKRHREHKAFAETLEIVLQSQWAESDLKAVAKRWVRSSLAVGIGWVQSVWRQDTDEDPVIAQRVQSLVDNIARMTALRKDLEDGAEGIDSGKLAEYERQARAIAKGTEEVTSQGIVKEFINAEDIQVATDVDAVTDYKRAPWIAKRFFMRKEKAKADFGLSEAKLNACTGYGPKDVVIQKRVSAFRAAGEISEDEADQFKAGDGKDDDCFVMGLEIWDRTSNTVLTTLEGCKHWVKPAWNPPPTKRFYPFFAVTVAEVDGQRHPQSLVFRTHRLADEYASVRTQFRTHRRRCIPKTAFDRGALDPADLKALEGATVAEMVGLKPLRNDVDVSRALAVIQYPAIDPALYDTSGVIGEMERIWGIQEALSQAIATPKTATEATIQQTGFYARSGSIRDGLDDALSDMAYYDAELTLHYMKLEEVQDIAGPDAFWPEGMEAADLKKLVAVRIRAGSSGKPNTEQERMAWQGLLPIIQGGITQIGQMRGSSPEEIADKTEELLREVVAKLADGVDVERFIPQSSGGPAQAAPAGGQGGPGTGPDPSAPDPRESQGIPAGDPLAAMDPV